MGSFNIIIIFIFLNISLVYIIGFKVYLYILAILVSCVLAYTVYTKRKKCKVPFRAGRGVLITGCDTGLGHDAALQFVNTGFIVFAGCLTPEGANDLWQKGGGGRLHVILLDVTSETSVQDAVEVVESKIADSELWAVINIAGVAFTGDIEIALIETMQRIAEVNLFGMIRVTKAFLPFIRKSKGRVINVTSAKGRIALPSDAPSTITQWAVEAFSDILRREMCRFGIKVVIIEPGHFAGITGMGTIDNGTDAEANLYEAWFKAPKHIKTCYDRKYIDSLIHNFYRVKNSSNLSREPVLDALQDAMENVSPKLRYLVHGNYCVSDEYCVLAVLNNVLPDSWMDFFVQRAFPIPDATEQNIF
ncbi:D-beta-hydroxybutyrate dehydrogenase, mitochondrial-like [Ruditapes philippinarum]|uniref:D-beta-hydroxybutyrate dehydrogenase, mitochondrial-like n=1 Tax=Ruditapes philippinarum TaxID=129788 RepID=UPI00295BD816|nr:D-beta-hydroxybutyrate dehydrogenase, mitochondrial-like [Ruditapes philippinarum]